MKRTLSKMLLATALLSAPAALDAQAQTDPRQALAEAEKAYADGMEVGNEAVRELIERDPGNTELAVAGLRSILGRSHASAEWTRYASERLIALQELGAVSWNQDVIFDIYHARFLSDLKAHRRLSAKLLHDELSTHYHGSHRFSGLSEQLRRDQPTYQSAPAPTGSPLAYFAPTELEGHWAGLRGADPVQAVASFDQIIEDASGTPEPKAWDGGVGNIDAWTAIDLHLRQLPTDQLQALRDLQEKKLQEAFDPSATDALSLFRRFPWAETAHRRLLDRAGADLVKGRLHAAYRSFDDVRLHSANAELRKQATAGCLVALSGLGDTESQTALFDQLDASEQLPWMGKSIPVVELRKQLQPATAKNPSAKVPILASLTLQTIAPPPTPPWKHDLAQRVHPELQVHDGHVVLSAHRYLASYARDKTDQPAWTRTVQGRLGDSKLAPGSYSPALIDGKVYARNRGTDTAGVMNVIDLASGSDLWSMGRYYEQRSGAGGVNDAPSLDDMQKFLSKPVLVDGALIYLSNEISDHDPRKYPSIVAVDAESRRVLWRSLIKANVASLPNEFGIPPIAHQGFVYTVSSQETVSCHDLRDGRPVWVHQYKTKPGGSTSVRYAGLPVIVGNRLICTPVDHINDTFALDLKTGRMLWSNPDILAVEQIGRHGDTVLVRDELSLAALSADDGKVRWGHRFKDPIVGRAQRIADRIYIPTKRGMFAVSAEDGSVIEQRPWDQTDGPPQAARIYGDRLYVVGNTPYLDPARRVLNPNAPKSPALKLPLQLAWTLPNTINQPVMTPPADSPLAGKIYYLADGVLTCAEASPQGGIVWQKLYRENVHMQPMFFGGLLVLRQHNLFVAFDGKTGEQRWSREVRLAGDVGSAGDVIWASDHGGWVAGLDANTGETLWQQNFATKQRGRPALSAHGNVMHVLMPVQGKLGHFVINSRTGERLKTYEEVPHDIEDGRWWSVKVIGPKGALLASHKDGERHPRSYYIYKMDGKKPRRLGDVSIVNVFAFNDQYAAVEEPEAQLAVYKFEDDGYRATPLGNNKFSRNNWYFELDGDRLIGFERGRRVVLFDLQTQKVLHDTAIRESQRPKPDKKHESRLQYVLRDGDRLFCQMSETPGAPAPSYFLDLLTGKASEAPGAALWVKEPSGLWMDSRNIPRYSNGLILTTAKGIQSWSPKE